MKKELVVVDVDDVLINLNKSVERRVNSLGYLAFKAENIKTYDLNKSVDVSMLLEGKRKLMDNGLGCPRDLIMRCYNDVRVFEDAELVENFYDGLKLLSENFNVLIHTSNFNLDIVRFKISLFQKYCSNLDLSYNFCVGSDKPAFPDAYAVFEDCVGNTIKYSESCKKILVDRPHNSELFNKESFSLVKNLQRVKNFYEGVEYLIKEC